MRIWRRSGWELIAAAVCALIVLLAGSRLVVLSVRQRAAEARTVAQQIADRAAVAMQAQLTALAQEAQQRASSAASGQETEDLRARLQAVPATRNAAWILADGTVVSSSADREAVTTLASEWSAVGTHPSAATTLGPIRQGSGWLVAVFAPLGLTSTQDGTTAAWSVVYRDLDTLLVGAQLDRAARSGYDFGLSRMDPTTRQAFPVSSSVTTQLVSPMISAISLPVDDAQQRGASWRLAIAPRAGWYPAQVLIVDVSLLILVTWLVGLGVTDVTRHMTNLRTALAVSRRRLQNAQHRLSQEIEQRQRLQKTFEHAHHHDAFTGLPNRHYLIDQLDRGLREMRTRGDYHVALMLIRVDRFNVITDTVGHTAGDELMVQITRLFEHALTSHERVLARWSDDEFALMLVNVRGPDDILDVAASLEQALYAPIELRRHRVAAAVTVGATFVESGLQRTEEVLREADIALSTAKPQGSSSVIIYSAALRDKMLQVVSLEADLHMALQRDEFRLRYQPIVELRSRRIVGVEVLLRWQHPAEGLLAPARFLRFAEDTGIIVPITHWIIQRTCHTLADWRPRLPPGSEFYMSINLSPAVLLDSRLNDVVRQALAQSGTAASSLKFELTENGLISNVSAARDALDGLHDMGIELMLDDFGTGYSSLSHLQLFPFDYIKIDGPMDSPLRPDSSRGALVRAMAQMAKTLGLRSIAEVVERKSAIETLQQIGCEFAQGYAFCPPLDAEQMVRRLRSPIVEAEDVREDEIDSSPTLILPVLSDVGD